MDLRVVILAMIQIVVAFFDDRTLDSSTIEDITPISENMHLYSVVAHTRLSLESSIISQASWPDWLAGINTIELSEMREAGGM
jgi:hypothetical protein